eukprot:SAG22_NODE_1216_length_5142_cov_2.131866_4_plen_196_part_00
MVAARLDTIYMARASGSVRASAARRPGTASLSAWRASRARAALMHAAACTTCSWAAAAPRARGRGAGRVTEGPRRSRPLRVAGSMIHRCKNVHMHQIAKVPTRRQKRRRPQRAKAHRPGQQGQHQQAPGQPKANPPKGETSQPWGPPTATMILTCVPRPLRPRPLRPPLVGSCQLCTTQPTWALTNTNLGSPCPL